MMTTHTTSLVSLVSLALLAACGVESHPAAPKLQANRFASSEWSEPVNLGPVVNSSAVDANAGLSPDEHTLYFVSNRLGGLGGNDIWMSHRQCLQCPWETPVNLGAPVNSDAGEAAPTMSEDGRLLFFFSTRTGGFGSADIYVSHRVSTGADGDTWGPPVNLGPDVNTAGAENGSYYVREGGEPNAVLYFNRTPAEKVAVRTDGLELLLSSSRTGSLGNLDLWVFTRQTVHDPWSSPVHLDAPINTPDIDSQPSLSRDGRTLIFTSIRPGGLGVQDLWMSTRTPSGQ